MDNVISPNRGLVSRHTQTITVPGVGDWVSVAGEFLVKMTGTASNVVWQLEYKEDTAAPSVPAADQLTVDPSSGLQPEVFKVPYGYVRVNISALSGGDVTVAIVGEAG